MLRDSKTIVEGREQGIWTSTTRERSNEANGSTRGRVRGEIYRGKIYLEGGKED